MKGDRWRDLLVRVRQMVQAMRELLSPGKQDRARPGELTWHHPSGRHGVYIRNDGTVDLQSRGSVVGVGPFGATVEAPSVYVGATSMVFRADRVGFLAPLDGYYLSGRLLNPELVAGKRLSSQLRDAALLVAPGSVKVVDGTRVDVASKEWPVVQVADKPFQMVPLSDLLEPIQMTLERTTSDWMNEMVSILRRGGG